MEDINNIETDLENIKSSYNHLILTLSDLKDIEGIDEEYKQLDIISQSINDKRLELELYLERLEEEAYIQENEEQWKAEQKEQEGEYWNSQF